MGLLLACAPAVGSPARVRTVGVGGKPIAVTTGAGGVWVLFDDGASERTLQRFDSRTMRPLGVPIAVGHGGSPNPFIGCCEPAQGLATAFGSVWVIDTAGQALLRVDPAQEGIVARIPIPGRPVDVARGPHGLWVLDGCIPAATPAPGALPCAQRALLGIDGQANAIAKTLLIDPGETVFGTIGPLGLVVGADRFWVVGASAPHYIGELPASGGAVGRLAPRIGWQVAASPAGTLWASARDSCDLWSKAPGGALHRVALALRQAAASDGIGGGPVCYPRGIAAGTRDVWALAFRSRTLPGVVVHLDARNGAPMGPPVKVGHNPLSIARDAQGSVWVVNRDDASLTRITPSAPKRRAT